MHRRTMPLLAALGLTFSSIAALSHDFSRDDIFVDHPWARPSMSASAPAAVYFDIENRGRVDDRLMSAETDRAEHVEIHMSMSGENGMTGMHPVEGGLIIHGGEKLSFESGAYHVMLIGLGGKLKAGERFPMTLEFEHAGEIRIEVAVEDRTPKSSSHMPH